MAAKIDWFYHRKNCVSCQKAEGYLAKHKIAVAAEADARKDRRGADEVLTLARKAREVIVAKGKKLVHFEVKSVLKTPDELVKAMLGPTGNLRAPTMLVGKTLLVGFSEEAYREHLGK